MGVNPEGRNLREGGRRVSRAIQRQLDGITVFLLGGGGEGIIIRVEIQERLEPEYHLVVMEAEPDTPSGDPFDKLEWILRTYRPTHYFVIALDDGNPMPGAQIELGWLRQAIGSSDELTRRTTIFWERGRKRAGLSAYLNVLVDRVVKLEFERSEDSEDPLAELEDLIAGRIEALAYALAGRG